MEGEPPRQEEERQREELAPSIEVRALPDPLIEQLGYGPRSHYVEVCWLPVLGPTATWLYRRLGTWAEAQPDGGEVDLIDLSVSLGLGEGLGYNSLMAKGLRRLVRFDAARWTAAGVAVRRALGPLPERYATKLSYSAYRFHREALERATGQAGIAALGRAAAQRVL
ncbi:MAG: hypothetical protein ACRD0N_05460 [Acidimicrobiales bacterium]